MEKLGSHQKTGVRSLQLSKEVEEFEHQPETEIPPPPVNVEPLKLAKLSLASRSPLSVAFRHINPSWHSYIQYVDLAARKGSTAMQRFLECYESLPKKDKMTIWPEQLCEMANVDPEELVGAVCSQLWGSKAAESSMISAIAHPEMLLKTIQLAKNPDNFRDREMYFRMAGSLPDKKGSSINIFTSAQAGSAEAKLPDLRPARNKLRSFDEEVIEMSRDLETGGGKTLSQVFLEEERKRPSSDVPFIVRDVPQEDH